MGSGGSKPAAPAASPVQTISAGSAPTTAAAAVPAQAAPVPAAATPTPAASAAPAAAAVAAATAAADTDGPSEFQKGVVQGEQQVLDKAQAAVDTVVKTAKLEIQRQQEARVEKERLLLDKWLRQAQSEMYRAPQRALGCQVERQNVLNCYAQNSDALACAFMVDAFEACSRKQLTAIVKP